MDERLGSIEQRLQEQHDLQQHQQQSMAELGNQLHELLTRLPILPAPPRNHEVRIHDTNNDGNHSRIFHLSPKLEFPVFDGSNPRIWVKKCKRYFELCKLAENQKVSMTSLYMVGKAESLVHSYMTIRPNVEWDDFVMDLCARFKENLGSNVVEEFNKLQQKGSLEDYLDAFEHLRGLMLQRNALLPETYFLDSFVGGLKPMVKPFVRALKPTTMAEAVELARCQEESLTAARTMNNKTEINPNRITSQCFVRSPTSNFQNNSNTRFSQPFQRTSQGLSNQKPSNFKKLTPAEMDEKRMKNLCFQCDEPYVPGHKCKGRLYNMVLVPMDSEDEEGGTNEIMDTPESMEEGGNMNAEFEEEPPMISLNAISGHTSYQTMRVQGKVKHIVIHILIDSGSTHNFCDTSVAQKLGCQITTIISLRSFCCQWGENCHYKGGCEMVLGVQWLSSLGPVVWDFDQLKMKFMYQGKRVVLRGITNGSLKWISGRKLAAELGKGWSNGTAEDATWELSEDFMKSSSKIFFLFLYSNIVNSFSMVSGLNALTKDFKYGLRHTQKVNESEIPLLHEHNGITKESGNSIEEERRLFYVAMTRARKRLLISYVMMDSNWQMLHPSRFVREIPSHLLEVQGDMSPIGDNKPPCKFQFEAAAADEAKLGSNFLDNKLEAASEELIDIEFYSGNTFLKRFDVGDRGQVSRIFHQWAKKKAFQNPKRLLDKISFVIDERLRTKNGNSKGIFSALKSSLKCDEALWFAEYVIKWEQIPADKRVHMMREKQEHFQKLRMENAMGSSIPTSKQIGYLHSLGCTVVPESKLHASRLIEQYKSI
ncbi:hypothetical protein KSS87_012166 [Heliosperma pusillum]|nr:hypothetical protein KSS87_012166 [Heliosperma pusillum]